MNAKLVGCEKWLLVTLKVWPRLICPKNLAPRTRACLRRRADTTRTELEQVAPGPPLCDETRSLITDTRAPNVLLLVWSFANRRQTNRNTALKLPIAVELLKLLEQVPTEVDIPIPPLARTSRSAPVLRPLQLPNETIDAVNLVDGRLLIVIPSKLFPEQVAKWTLPLPNPAGPTIICTLPDKAYLAALQILPAPLPPTPFPPGATLISGVPTTLLIGVLTLEIPILPHASTTLLLAGTVLPLLQAIIIPLLAIQLPVIREITLVATNGSIRPIQLNLYLTLGTGLLLRKRWQHLCVHETPACVLWLPQHPLQLEHNLAPVCLILVPAKLQWPTCLTLARILCKVLTLPLLPGITRNRNVLAALVTPLQLLVVRTKPVPGLRATLLKWQLTTPLTTEPRIIITQFLRALPNR